MRSGVRQQRDDEEHRVREKCDDVAAIDTFVETFCKLAARLSYYITRRFVVSHLGMTMPHPISCELVMGRRYFSHGSSFGRTLSCFIVRSSAHDSVVFAVGRFRLRTRGGDAFQLV